ncbi:MAG: hypothetical protein N2663_01790 [Chlorobi bacterium]|nr:hypothetical protein [Chlorobiota bacterium]
MLILLLLLCTVAASAQTPARKPSTAGRLPNAFVYRLQPKADISYRYAASMEMDQTLHIMDFDQAIRSRVSLQQVVVPHRVTDTLLTLVVRQRDIRVELKGLEQLGRTDSLLTFPELEDYETHILCNRHGQTLSQTIVSKDTSAAVAQSVRRQAIEQLTNSGVRMRLLVEFPDTPLAPGTQWTRTISDTITAGVVGQNIATTMDLRYTFDGLLDTLGRRCAVVRVESVRYLLSGTAEQMGMTMGISGDGVYSARYLLEVESGMPLVIETLAQLDQRMTLYDQGNTVIPMTVDIRGRMVRRL